MKKLLVFGVALALVTLGACSSFSLSSPLPAIPQADLQNMFKNACAGVSIADGAFQAASPALVASGRLTTDQVAQEKGIMAVVQGTCANPPTDVAAATVGLVGDASAIYLLLAPKS